MGEVKKNTDMGGIEDLMGSEVSKEVESIIPTVKPDNEEINENPSSGSRLGEENEPDWYGKDKLPTDDFDEPQPKPEQESP